MSIFFVILAIFSNWSIVLASQRYEVITIQERGDGFGAHVLDNVAAFIYAEMNNKEFCYRPFKIMEHNYNNDPDFTIKKEWLLNFKDNFITLEEAEKKKYLITAIHDSEYLKFFNKHIKTSAESLEKLKRIFRANKQSNYFNNSHLNIAVHIRRKNPHDNRIYGTDIPDEFYLKIINTLRIKYQPQNPLFHIYSQGNIDSFKLYASPDVVLRLNESVEETYQGMVFADVLVTGRSSFSYTAGLLSDGIIYYNNYDLVMHHHLPHWISIEKLIIREKRCTSYNLVPGQPAIYVTKDSEKIGSSWQNGTVANKKLVEKFYSLLPHDKFFVVFDIGAQTGRLSLLAKYFPHSQWYSFEPIKEAADTLRENSILNDIENVAIYQKAVSEIPGNVTLKMPEMKRCELSTIGAKVLRFDTLFKREVECIKLDHFITYYDIKKVDFMILDTEGSELFILRGARRIIQRDRPIILMKYNEISMKQCNASKEYIDTVLKEMNYTGNVVSDEYVLCIPKND